MKSVGTQPKLPSENPVVVEHLEVFGSSMPDPVSGGFIASFHITAPRSGSSLVVRQHWLTGRYESAVLAAIAGVTYGASMARLIVAGEIVTDDFERDGYQVFLRADHDRESARWRGSYRISKNWNVLVATAATETILDRGIDDGWTNTPSDALQFAREFALASIAAGLKEIGD